MAWDSSGSLFALGVRLTKIDATGAPIAGTDTCYQTEGMIQIGVGLEYREGIEVEQINGSGNICLGYSAPATLKRGTISDFQFCTPDPNVLQFCQGGTIIAGPAATAEVQTITITGTPTGGDFTLTFDGETTGPIAFDALGTAVDTALEALPNIDSAGVTVTGSAGGPYSVTFLAAAGNVPQIGANGSGLTGGTDPDVTVVTATPGNALTDIGYAAPEVGTSPTPNGLGIEFWTAAIQNGAYADTLPYMRWVLPRAQLTPSGAWTAEGENPLLPGFEGFSYQNSNWGAGPLGDWPYISERVWQYARVAELPDLTPGFVTVA